MQEKIEMLKKMIEESKSIVFFGGAGVSTESGIPDFRSVDGLYNQKYKYPPETILSKTFFYQHTKDFYDFYRDKMNCLNAEPNITHYKLAELEAAGKLTSIATQNIDGLHQKAGSKTVYELHGTIHKNKCTQCRKEYSAEFVMNSTDIPRCECGGLIKPEVTLYEESLPIGAFGDAQFDICRADMLIVGGTSLSVFPAATLVESYWGNKLVVINKTPTESRRKPDLFIQASLGEVFSQL